MPRMKKMVEREDGWCDWVQPAELYRMGCCDCGLVHDMQFRIVRVKEDLGNGVFTLGDEIPRTKALVHFRARRNERSTAALRRKKGAK